MMTIGYWLLLATGLLLLFGVGQRALDRLRLTDRQAIMAISAMLVLGLVPDVPVTARVSVNLGGAVVPLLLSAYLLVKADTWGERVCCVAASLVTAAAVYLIGRYFPAAPEAMPFDVNYLYGLAGGAIAYIFGRSRRGAFVAGVMGVLIADVTNAGMVWAAGVDQRLVLGGAGAADAVVISGLTAVLLAELIGEVTERAVRGRQRPQKAFVGGEFVEKERGE